MPSFESLIAARELVVYYGTNPVNQPITFSLDQGQIGLIYGNNGSGKTSIVRCLIGQVTNLLGEVRVLGTKPKQNKLWKTVRMGLRVIPQFPLLADSLTVGDYLGACSRYVGMDRRSVDPMKEMTLALKEVGVQFPTLMKELSFGQRRAVDIALAIIAKPRVLIADEPLAGLSPTLIDSVKNRIVNYVSLGGSAIVMAHHSTDAEWPAAWAKEVVPRKSVT